MAGKLGKLPAAPSPTDFKLSSFLQAGVTLPTPPTRFGHGTMFKDWGMLGNDQVGDCVPAGGAHETMETNKLVRRIVTFLTGNVIGDYSAVTGYNPGDPSSDQGTDVRTFLSYRRHTGIIDENGTRHKIGAYISIAPKDFDLLMQATYVFSAVGIGFEFPSSGFDQFDNGEPWDVVPGDTIEGGHYVPVMGRSSKNVAGCVTWGRRQGMTREFYETYNDEAWAIVYPEELNAKGLNERGFDLAALNAALAAL